MFLLHDTPSLPQRGAFALNNPDAPSQAQPLGPIEDADLRRKLILCLRREMCLVGEGEHARQVTEARRYESLRASE